MKTKTNLIAISGRQNSGKDTVGSIAQFLLHTEGIWDRKTFDIYQTRPSKGVASNWQHYWEIKKFAGKLKQIATLLTGVPIEKWEDQEFKKTFMPEEWSKERQLYECDQNNRDGYAVLPMTYREFLQKLETEAVRNGLHDNTWVNALFVDYKLTRRKVEDEEYESVLPNWIITDMRFPNEFDAVKQHKGFTVKVEREFPCAVCKLTLADRRGQPCYDIACPLGRPNKGLHESETALDGYAFDYVINNNSDIETLVKEVRKMLEYFKL